MSDWVEPFGAAQLYVDGSQEGSAATRTEDWVQGNWASRTTGWTPVRGNWGVLQENGPEGHATESWTLVGIAGGGLGFSSTDDRNNTVSNEANRDAVSFTIGYSLGVTGGVNYDLTFPLMFGAATANGVQYVTGSYSGAGIPETQIIKAYTGIVNTSVLESDHADYQFYGDGATSISHPNVTPLQDGIITVNYTFTLVKVFGLGETQIDPGKIAGNRQNADIWVGQPSFGLSASCQ